MTDKPVMIQYICLGAHCKCMNLDGKCSNYHKGDHTCPWSDSGFINTGTKNEPPTILTEVSTPPESEELDTDA